MKLTHYETEIPYLQKLRKLAAARIPDATLGSGRRWRSLSGGRRGYMAGEPPQFALGPRPA